MINWLKNSFSWGPPIFKSLVDGGSFYIGKFRPFTNREGIAPKCYIVVCSSIIGLFLFGCPSNIARFIIAIIVYTVYAMFFRGSCPNVIIKSYEVMSPRFADFYTAATIEFPANSIGVGTPFYNAFPCMKFWRVRHAVRRIALFNTFLVKTATALCGFRRKGTALNNSNVSTNAQALPINTTVPIFGTFKNSKAIKILFSKINEFRHYKNLQAKVASILRKKRKAGCLSPCLVGPRALSA